MHYKNGREAKVGDQVVGRHWQGDVFAGTLVRANAEATTCNGHIFVAASSSGQGSVLANVTIGELVHADDLFAAFEAQQATEKARRAADGGPAPVPGQS